MDTFLGCSGFYYNHWRGKFYPENLPKQHWLPYYAQRFNTLEVNNTFYRYPSIKMLSDWYRKTPQEFRFTLKANRAITHRRKFKNTEKLTADFNKLAHILNEKIICILYQLPSIIQKDMKLLQTIASQIDTSLMNVLEFRHKSWWDNEVYDFLSSHGLIFCSVSAPELPEDIIPSHGMLYLRFHGKNGWYQHNYPDEELRTWAQKIKQQSPSKILCYFNNDTNANAPRNCLTLKTMIQQES